MNYPNSLTYPLMTLALLAIATILHLTHSIISPLLIAIMISMILHASIQFLKKKIPTFLASSIVLTLLCLSAFLAYSIITHASQQITVELPLYSQMLSDFSHTLPISVQKYIAPLMQTSEKYLDTLNISTLFDFLNHSLVLLGTILSEISLITLAILFIFLEMRLIKQKFSLFSDTMQQKLSNIYSEIQNYLLIKGVCSLLMSIISFIILKILNFPFADLIALLTFFLHFIPNIGSLIIIILTAFLSLLSSNVYTMVLTISACTIIHIIFNALIEPIWLEKKLNLSNLTIFLSLILWGSILGNIGILLAVPLSVILKIIFEHYPMTQKIALMMSASLPNRYA